MVQPMSAMALMLALVLMQGCTSGGIAHAGLGSLERRVESRGLGSAERVAERRMLGTLERDAARDRATAARILKRDRVVARYTTKARAETEMREGLKVGTHMNSRLSAGRPLTALHAQRRYGLPVRPEVRERIVLMKGTKVRMNKAMGGQPGIGEITVTRRAPASVVREIQRVK